MNTSTDSDVDRVRRLNALAIATTTWPAAEAYDAERVVLLRTPLVRQRPIGQIKPTGRRAAH